MSRRRSAMARSPGRKLPRTSRDALEVMGGVRGRAISPGASFTIAQPEHRDEDGLAASIGSFGSSVDELESTMILGGASAESEENEGAVRELIVTDEASSTTNRRRQHPTPKAPTATMPSTAD